jgi:RND family efflux transporter MFP subunit
MKWIRLLVVLCSVHQFSCDGKQETSSQEQSRQAPIRTIVVSRQPGALELAGTVRAKDVANLAGRTAGFVSRVLVKAGARVTKGQLLLVVDDRNLKAQADKLQAARQEIEQAIGEAQHQLNAAEAQNQFAANTFNRISGLYEKKAASKQEFEEAEARKKSAEAALQAARERVAQAQSKSKQIDSDLQDVSASLGYVQIAAPFDGTVTSVPADTGTFVNPGQTLITMESSSYEIVFFVEESLLPSVTKGKQIAAIVPAVSNDSLTATVSEVAAAVDTATRTFQAKADLPSGPPWKSGLSATVFLEAEGRPGLWIPAEFLSRSHDIETVLVRQDQQWRRVLVKSGREKEGKVEILSGINEGDEIALFGEKQ